MKLTPKHIAIVALFIFVALTYSVFSSPATMAKIATLPGSNQTQLYTFCLDRIYSNIECNEEKYLQNIKATDPLSEITWNRVLAVSGNRHFAEHIQKKLEKTVLEKQRSSSLPQDLVAAGSLGLFSARDLLFEIARDKINYDKLERSLAITALYDLDGVNYGEQFGHKYIVDQKMKNAREAILESKGRCRTPVEMVAIDQTYRSTN